MKPVKTKPRGRFTKKRKANGAPGKRDARGWLDNRRRHDRGPKQDARPLCDCSAYKYKHIKFGARCSPDVWVEEFFDPHKTECRDCMCLDEQTMTCQVVEGLETVLHCPELRDYIRCEGIKLYGKLRRAMDRMTGKNRR